MYLQMVLLYLKLCPYFYNTTNSNFEVILGMLPETLIDTTTDKAKLRPLSDLCIPQVRAEHFDIQDSFTS
jgi:hypothetical protein